MPISPRQSSTPTYPTGVVGSCISKRIPMRAGRIKVAIDPHLELFMALAAAAAWLMIRAGLAKNALELRRRQVACPSCGKTSGCTCGKT